MAKKIKNESKNEFVFRKYDLKKTMPELYRELARESERVRKRQWRRGECWCPVSKKHLCDGDCEGCNYRKESRMNIRLDDADAELIASDVLPPDRQYEIREFARRMEEHITDTYGKVYMEIFRLESEGIPERDIAEIVQMPRTTIRDRLSRIRKELNEKFGDEIPF